MSRSTTSRAVAWVVTDVQTADGIELAADVAELDVRNPVLTLTPGLRYRFDNNGGAAHPLDFRKANARFLLAQGNPPGSLEDDDAVDFVDDAEGVTFTLTPEVGGRTWRSTPAPSTRTWSAISSLPEENNVQIQS